MVQQDAAIKVVDAYILAAELLALPANGGLACVVLFDAHELNQPPRRGQTPLPYRIRGAAPVNLVLLDTAVWIDGRRHPQNGVFHRQARDCGAHSMRDMRSQPLSLFGRVHRSNHIGRSGIG